MLAALSERYAQQLIDLQAMHALLVVLGNQRYPDSQIQAATSLQKLLAVCPDAVHAVLTVCRASRMKVLFSTLEYPHLGGSKSISSRIR